MKRRILSALLAVCVASALLVPVSADQTTIPEIKFGPVPASGSAPVRVARYRGLGSIDNIGGLADTPAAINIVDPAAFDDEHPTYYYELDQNSKAVYDAIEDSKLGTEGPQEGLDDDMEWDGSPGFQAAYAAAFKIEIPLTDPFTIVEENDKIWDDLDDIVTPAILALMYDNPRLSWLVNTPYMLTYETEYETNQGNGSQDICTKVIYVASEDAYQMATIGPDAAESQGIVAAGSTKYSYADTEDLDAIRTAIGTAKSGVEDKLKSVSEPSAYDKVEAIHDWICENVEYTEDNDLFEGGWRGYQTAYSALVDGVTVCAGYAKSFKILCEEYNIDCIIVSGTGYNGSNGPDGEPHAWNYVRLEESGPWYAVDCTWDDNGETAGTNYFLVGSDTFNDSNHRAEGKWDNLSDYTFAYPALSTSACPRPAELKEPYVAAPLTADKTATYGDQLSTIGFTGGTVHASSEDATPVSGDWAWVNGDQPVGDVSTDPNTFTARFTPSGEDAGKYSTVDAEVQVTVQAKTLTEAMVPSITETPEYTGSQITPTVTVTDTELDETLNLNTDYTVSYGANKDVKDGGTVTINGDGNYQGTVNANFTIKAKTITVTVEIEPQTYDGTQLTPDVKVTGNGVVSTDTFTENTDYTVSYTTADPTNAGNVPVTVSPVDRSNYTFIAVTENFVVNRRTIGGGDVEVESPVKHTGGALTPTVTVTVNGTELNQGFDYSVTYDNNVEIGTNATATVTGLNNYMGTVTKNFEITDLERQEISFGSDTVSKTYGDAKFTETATNSTVPDGTITYSSSDESVAEVDSGTGEVTITGAGTAKITATAARVEGQYAETSVSYTLTVDPKPISVSVDAIDNQTYNEGKDIEPEVSLTVSGTIDGYTLLLDTDYTVSYSNNVNAGTAGVTVKANPKPEGLSNYTFPDANGSFTIDKAEAPELADISRSHRYNAGDAGSVDLSGLVTGATGYSIASTEGDTDIISGQTVSGAGLLTYTCAVFNDYEEKSVTITVTITSQNYKDAEVKVIISLTDKSPQAPLTFSNAAVAYPNTLTLRASGGSGSGDYVYSVEPDNDVATVTPAGVLTPLKAGSVEVTVYREGDDDYEVSASVTATVTINKGTPTVVPRYTEITSGGKTLADANLTTGAGTNPSGTISWNDPATTSVAANASYAWTFRPSDTDNWNTATGSIVLWNYTPPASSGSSSDGGDSGSSGGGTGSNTVSTGSTTSNGERVTATTATPSATVSDGAASTTVTGSMGQRIVDQAVRNDSDTVVINPQISGSASSSEVTIPADTVRDIGSRTNADLQVNSPAANVTIPNSALASLASGGDLTVTASSRDGVISVDISSGGSSVRQVPGGVTAEIPASRCQPGTVAMLVASDGSTTVIRKSIADTAAGVVSVPLDGSAQLVIVNNSKSFADIPANSWAASAVEFISAREIMSGTGDDYFSPSSPMTRGMLATILHNIESNPRVSNSIAFPDVGTEWYAEGVRWAAGQGIIAGYDDGRCGPEDMLTREQLASMLYRYAGQPSVSYNALSFTDSDQVSAWAEDAVRWAVSAGILSGSENRLDPGGQATRAQAASMLMRFMIDMEK